MTERRAAATRREAGAYVVGPSAISFDGTRLTLDIDERGAPIPFRVKGRIIVHPRALNTRAFAIDSAGRHRWMPLMPTADIEVAMSHPALSWRGHAYVDTNAGSEPVRAAFRSWDWSRADVEGGAAVLYDVVEKDGAIRQIAARFLESGGVEEFVPPPRVALPRTVWGIRRQTQADPGAPPRVLRTLEDTPFYARSVLETRLLGQTATAMHETLDVARLDTPIVRMMLPFRMPRVWW